LHITDLLPVDVSLGVALDDDEHVVSFIALMNQLLAGSEMLEASRRTNLRLFQTCQCVGQ